jgi:hypothetical protein
MPSAINLNSDHCMSINLTINYIGLILKFRGFIQIISVNMNYPRRPIGYYFLYSKDEYTPH